jgi:hypothetical protein
MLYLKTIIIFFLNLISYCQIKMLNNLKEKTNEINAFNFTSRSSFFFSSFIIFCSIFLVLKLLRLRFYQFGKQVDLYAKYVDLKIYLINVGYTSLFIDLWYIISLLLLFIVIIVTIKFIVIKNFLKIHLYF